MALTLEKKIMTELIQMYRDQQCLWDTSNLLYSNKQARNRAHNVLLEKYRILDSTADQRKMKKKIENMRTTYKRERAKVIKSQLSGGAVYDPSLWYYSEFEFLDEMNDSHENETVALSVDAANDDDDGAVDSNDEERSNSPGPTSLETPPPPQPVKRSKPSYFTESDIAYNEIVKKSLPKKKAKISSVYLAEDGNEFQEESSYSIKDEPSDLYVGPTPESDLFGKTIAAQLNELRPKQRFIAEKLISEVIFFGRLYKLKTGTSLNLKNDCY